MADHEVASDTLHDARHEQSEPISEIDSTVEAPTRNEPSSEAIQVPQADITEECEAPSTPKKKKKKKNEGKSPSSFSTPTTSTLQDTEADSVEQIDAESEVDDVLNQDTGIVSSTVEAECPESSPPKKKKKVAAIDPDQPADTPEELTQPSLSADSQPVTMEESQKSDGKSPIPNLQANDASEIPIQELEVLAQGPEQSLLTADESLVTTDKSPETQDDATLPKFNGPQPVEPKEISGQDHKSAQPEKPIASFDEPTMVESATAPEPSSTGGLEISQSTSEDPQSEPKEKSEVLDVLDKTSGSETLESAPSSDLQEMSSDLKDLASENSPQVISEEPNSVESHATKTNSTPVESVEQDAEPIDEFPQTNEPESAEEVQVKVDELLENQLDHEEQASASAAESFDALPTDGLEVESEVVHQESQVPETLTPEEVEAPIPSIDVAPESQAEDDPSEKQASDDDTKEPEVSPGESVPELELPGDAVAENTIQDGDTVTEIQEAPSLPTETEYTISEKAPQSPATEDLLIQEEVPIPKSQDDVSEDAAKPDDEHKSPPLETSDTHPVQESDSVPEVSISGVSQEEHITEAPQEQAPLEFTEVSNTNQLDDGKDKEIDDPIAAEKLLDTQPQQDFGLLSDSQEPQAIGEAVESPHDAVVEPPTIEIPVDIVFEASDALLVQAPFEDTSKDHQIDTMVSETVASDGQSFTLPPSDHINLTPSTIQSEFSAIGDEELAAIVRGVIPVESDEAVDEDNSDARTEVAEPVAQLDEVVPETELSNLEMISDDAQPVNGSVASDVSPPEETMSEIDVGSIEPKHSLDVESSQEKVEASSELSHQSKTPVGDSKADLTISESLAVPQEAVPDQLDENKKESKELDLGAAPVVIQEASALNEATSVDESTPVTEEPVASDTKSITENTSGFLPEDVPETPLQDISADDHQSDEALKAQPFEESKSAQNDSVAAIKNLTLEQKSATKESVEVNKADDIVDSPSATKTTKETEQIVQTPVDETAAPEPVKKTVEEAAIEETNVIGVVSTEVEPVAVTEESPLENETGVTVPSTEEATIKSDANLEPSSSTVEMEQSVDETEPTFSLPEPKDIDAIVEPKNKAPVLEVYLNEVSSEVEAESLSAPEVELVVTETQEPAFQAEDELFTSATKKLVSETEGPIPVSDVENSGAIPTEETFEKCISQIGSELLASPIEDVPVSEAHEAISKVEPESFDDAQDQLPTPLIEDHGISPDLVIEVEAPVKNAGIEVPNSVPEQDGTSLETESETEAATVDASESEVPAVTVKHEKTISEPENEIGASTVSAEIEEISPEANALVETVENELEAPAHTIEDDKMTSEHKSEVEASVSAVENTTPNLEAEREVPQTEVEVDTPAPELQAEPCLEAQSEVTTCSIEDKAVIAEPETVVVTPILETEARKTEAQETAVNPEIVASELEPVEVSAPFIGFTSDGMFPDDKISQTKEASSLEVDTVKEDSDVPEAPTEVTSAEIKDTTEAAKLVVDDSPQDASANVDNYLESGVAEPTETQYASAAVEGVAPVQTGAEDLPVSHEAELQSQDVNNVLEQPEDIVASEESAHLLEPHILNSQASEARGPADDVDSQAEKEIESSPQPIAATATVTVYAATVAAAVTSESESAMAIPNNGSEGVSKEEEVPKTNMMAEHDEMKSIKLTDDDVATQDPSLVSEVPVHDEAPAEAAPEDESRDENVRYIQYSDLPRTITAPPPPVPAHQPYDYDGYGYRSYPPQNPPALGAQYYHGGFMEGAEGYVSNPDAYILDQQHQAQGNNIVYSHPEPLHQVQKPGYLPSSNSRSNFTGYQYDRLPSSTRQPAHVHQYSHWDINGESKPLQQPKVQPDGPPVAVVFKPSQLIKPARAPPVVDGPAPSRHVTASGPLKDPTANDTDFIHVEASSPDDEYHGYHVTTKADTRTKGSSRRIKPRRQHSPELVSDEDSVEVPPRRSSRKSTKSSSRSHRSKDLSSSVPVHPPISEPEPQTPRDFVEVSTPSSPLDSPEIISTSDAVDPQATPPHIARSIPVDSPPTMESNSPKKKHISPRKQQPEIAPEIAPAPHVAVSSSKNEAPQRFRPAEKTVSFSLDDAPRSKQRRRISDRNQDSSSRKSHKYETRRQPVMPHPIFTGGLPSSRSNSIKGSGNERRQSEFGDPMIARSDSARSHRSSGTSKGRDTPVAKYLDSNIPPSAHESQESSEREIQRLERRRQRERERETEQKRDEDRRHRSIRRNKGKEPMVASSLDSPVLSIPPRLSSQFPSLSPNPAAYADHSSLQFGTSPFAIQDFLPSAATAASPDRDRGRISKGYIRDLGYSGRDFKLEAERHRDELKRSRSTNARSSGSHRISDYTLDSSRPPPSYGNTFGYGLGISDGVTGRRASVDAAGPRSSEFAWAGTVNEVIIKQKKELQEEESKRKKRSEERKKMKEDSEKKSGLRAAFKRFLF